MKLLKSEKKEKRRTFCKVLQLSHFDGLIHKNAGASVSSAFIGKGISLFALETRLLPGTMLIKKVYLGDSRLSPYVRRFLSSLLVGSPWRCSVCWLTRQLHLSLICLWLLQIGCFKASLYCFVIGRVFWKKWLLLVLTCLRNLWIRHRFCVPFLRFPGWIDSVLLFCVILTPSCFPGQFSLAFLSWSKILMMLLYSDVFWSYKQIFW